MFLEHGLNKMLQEHPNPFVRNRCALMLGTREQLHNLVPLEEALSDSEFYVRLAAAFAIWKHRYPGITRRYGIGPVTEDSFLTYMNISRIPEPYDPEERKTLERFIEKVKKDFVSDLADPQS
jgi:HEAT repeat protein